MINHYTLIQKIFLVFIMLCPPHFTFAQKASLNSQEVQIGCLLYPEMQKSYVINSEVEYKELKNHKIKTHPMCDSVAFPVIDFNKNTLLVFITHTPACSRQEYTVSLLRNNNNIEFNIQTNINSKTCKYFEYNGNFYLVEKISGKENIEFNLLDL